MQIWVRLTQDEDIVHAYNLIHSVISDIAIFRENIEKDFHDWFMDASRIGSTYSSTSIWKTATQG